MPVTRNALIRYKILDSCFRNPGKKYFIDDLVEECCLALEKINPDTNGISLRSVRDDIAFMKSNEGWNIELGDFKEGRKKIYRYANPNFSINNMPLNDLEINQLQSAFDILSQFKGMPQFEWTNELLPKLKQGISNEVTSSTIIEFDNNQYLKGIEKIGDLYNAIFYKKILQVSYQPFENDTADIITLHPYYLKQYNNGWFLFGYNPFYEKYDWILALDRIVKIEEIKGNYQKNTKIKWADYFEDIIGVTKPEDATIQNITLHFLGKTGKYMETKPLHGSQKSKWINTDTLEVNLALIINYEFVRLILSYAESVKVIKPKSLAATIKNRIKKALNQYERLK